MTNSVLNSPPQLPAAGAWGSLYGVQEPLKCQRVPVVPAAAKKKQPAYGVKRNLEMCTEALGCETGGVDTAADDVDVGMARKRHAWEQEEEEESKAEAMERRVRVLPPPLTTLAAGAPRMRMVHERRDGRLEVYAVRSSGMEAERSGGRLRLRFHSCTACKCNAAKCSQQESQEGEELEADQRQRPEDAHVVAKYARGGRCVEAEGGATSARRGGKWEPEQAAAFWVAIT
ncbi:hypothetical protein CFC21_097729 [Triticum aestivum]|uniref:FAF domain-containing protein n=2 Tax=Triticum aestivum TaxID=4565 RepID=A0A9R1LV71_WHEAT|nr:hypothetical protein CFC21_097729 [Triticum aestivum]